MQPEKLGTELLKSGARDDLQRGLKGQHSGFDSMTYSRERVGGTELGKRGEPSTLVSKMLLDQGQLLAQRTMLTFSLSNQCCLSPRAEIPGL